MDSKKLDTLRARYAATAASQSHNPEFRKIIEQVFAGTDRGPSLTRVCRRCSMRPCALGRCRMATWRASTRRWWACRWTSASPTGPARGSGPRAVRAIERIGPYHHVHRLAPLAELKVADIGDVPFRSRFSLEESHQDIEAFYAKLVAAGVVPLSVGGDHSITLADPGGGRREAAGRDGAYRCPLRHRRALRGLEVPSRRSVPAGGAGGRAGPGADHPDRHPRRRPNICGSSPTRAA